MDIQSNTCKIINIDISDTGKGRKYSVVDNILKLDKDSEIYLIQEGLGKNLAITNLIQDRL